MTCTFCSIARAAALAAAMIATAAQPAIARDDDHAPRVAINLETLDLAAPQVVAAARHQINQAAWAVCHDVVDVEGLNLQKTACVRTARAEGNRQLDTLVQRSLAARASGQTILLAGKAP